MSPAIIVNAMRFMNIVFLDTETTDIVNPRLVQLAYKNATTGESVNALFKPPVPISFGSMATHHITEAMVADKPVFIGSVTQLELIDVMQESIIVAHNVAFDQTTLANEGVGVLRSIDTEQVARHVVKSDRYALQYLRYALDLNVAAQAHDAWGDVLVLEALYYYLCAEVQKKFMLSTGEQVVEKMMELSVEPVLLISMMFGKYKGKTFVEVIEIDKQYLEWLYGSKTENGTSLNSQDENLVHTLRYHLQINSIPPV